MNIRFYVDPETGAPHIYKHGVDEEEVIDVLSSPGEDRPGRGRFAGCYRQDASGALSSGDLCSRPGTGERICDYRVRVARETIVRISKTLTSKEQEMRQGKYPPGWDEKKVQRVLKHYEQQSEEEAVAEDEAAYEDSTQTIMEVPRELVPAIREMIAKHKRSRRV